MKLLDCLYNASPKDREELKQLIQQKEEELNALRSLLAVLESRPVLPGTGKHDKKSKKDKGRLPVKLDGAQLSHLRSILIQVLYERAPQDLSEICSSTEMRRSEAEQCLDHEWFENGSGGWLLSLDGRQAANQLASNDD